MTAQTAKQPIRVGDEFEDSRGRVWTVTEDLKFGRGFWCVTGRARQGVLHRDALERMTRLATES